MKSAAVYWLHAFLSRINKSIYCHRLAFNSTTIELSVYVLRYLDLWIRIIYFVINGIIYITLCNLYLWICCTQCLTTLTLFYLHSRSHGRGKASILLLLCVCVKHLFISIYSKSSRNDYSLNSRNLKSIFFPFIIFLYNPFDLGWYNLYMSI